MWFHVRSGRFPVVWFHVYALDQIRFRGASEEEVIDVIRNSAWESAELGRLECRKNLPFQKE